MSNGTPSHRTPSAIMTPTRFDRRGPGAPAQRPRLARWTSWVGALRHRWTVRRGPRGALELVWLRLQRLRGAAPIPSPSYAPPAGLRLAIHPTFIIRWGSATPVGAAVMDAQIPRAGRAIKGNAAPITVRSRPPAGLLLSRWGARVTSPVATALAGSRQHRDQGREGLPHTWRRGGIARAGLAADAPGARSSTPHAFVPPLGLLRRRRDGHLLTRGADDSPASSVRRQMRRVEPRAIAPPPIVARAPRREQAAPATSWATEELQSAAPFPRHGRGDPREADARFGWATPAPGAHGPSVSPSMLTALTDQVMRQINDRVRAKRERLGKV